MRVCDGCGASADETHIRERIERLELATRFRPIHIQVLLLGDAPADRAEDDFYRPQPDGPVRSTGSREFFREMMVAAGMPRDAEAKQDAALVEFQRRGFYLADALECPVASPGDLRARIAKAGPTVVKRIEFSYRPKHVVLIGHNLDVIIPILQKTSIANRIVLLEHRSGDSATSLITGSIAGSITGDQIAAALARLS
jgi:hypothetical protein